jgi:hypothetical protein
MFRTEAAVTVAGIKIWLLECRVDCDVWSSEAPSHAFRSRIHHKHCRADSQLYISLQDQIQA